MIDQEKPPHTPPKAVAQAKPAPAAKKEKKKPSAENQKARGNILVKLERLRTLAKDICRVYTANIERDILEACDVVAARQKGGNALGGAALDKVGAILDKLDLKPQKGKRRDLKKIEKSVDSIMSALSKKK
jgi:hypothetical protein